MGKKSLNVFWESIEHIEKRYPSVGSFYRGKGVRSGEGEAWLARGKNSRMSLNSVRTMKLGVTKEQAKKWAKDEGRGFHEY